MTKQTIVLIAFALLHLLSIAVVSIPFHREVATISLLLLFGISIVGSIALFIAWRRPVIHGVFFLIWAVGLMVVFFVAWGSNWFTAVPDEGILATNGGVIPRAWLSDTPVDPADIPPYGESIAVNGIYQPLSTLSDIAFITSGFLIILLASLMAGDKNQSDILPVGNSPAVLWQRPFLWMLIVVVIFMGPASMYLHASFRNWAGWTDSFSVYNLGLFGLSFLIFRLIYNYTHAEVSAWVFSIGVYVILLITFGFIGTDPGARIYLIAAAIGLWLLAEVAVVIIFASTFAGRGYAIAWWWGVVFLVLFGAAGVFKFFIEESDKFLTAYQPHAIFHICAAIALPAAFLYWVSERAPAVPKRPGSL